MTIHGQKAVACTVPCTHLEMDEADDGVLFRFPEAVLLVHGDPARRVGRRIREARSKRCGQFRIVLQFPANNRRGAACATEKTTDASP